MSRSLKVPGSPSSELHTRNFAPGNWRGMKLHLRPVGKPAPPRPRSADFFTSAMRSEEHTSELQSRLHLVCRLLLEKKKTPCAYQTEPCPTAPRQVLRVIVVRPLQLHPALALLEVLSAVSVGRSSSRDVLRLILAGY